VASYKREFTAPAVPPGQRFYLDLGAVREDARVRLNGTELEVRSWPPYLWDVTAVIKAGANTLEVQVQLPAAGGGRGGFGGGGGGGGRRGAAAPTAEAAPKGFGPTGVPGGLTAEVAGGGRGRGGAGAVAGVAGRGGAGGAGGRGGQGAPALPAPTAGLLGPVRLLAQ
jgi:hypothetical protein